MMRCSSRHWCARSCRSRRFAKREDHFQLLRIASFVGRLCLMPPFRFLRRHFSLAVGMQPTHDARYILEPLGSVRRHGGLGMLPGLTTPLFPWSFILADFAEHLLENDF